MENKEFRNALVNAMKAEIAQLGNEQREQKKTRKLANRPKEKSLQDIVDEINNRAYKIYNLLYPPGTQTAGCNPGNRQTRNPGCISY